MDCWKGIQGKKRAQVRVPRELSSPGKGPKRKTPGLLARDVDENEGSKKGRHPAESGKKRLTHGEWSLT